MKFKKKWVIRLMLIFLGVIFCYFVIFHEKDNTTIATDVWVPIKYEVLTNSLGLVGHVEAGHRIILSAPFDGVLREVRVRPGDKVSTGDVIFIMDTSLLQIQLRDALSELLQTKREATRLKNWSQDPEISRMRRQINIAASSLSNTRSTLEETQGLYKRGIVARNEVDNLRFQILTQSEDLKNLRDELSALEARADDDALQIANIAFINAQARYSSLKSMLSSEQVKTPYKGLVLPAQALGSEKPFFVEAGLHVTQGTPILTVSDLGNFVIMARVQEDDIHLLKEGMKVNITGEGFRNISYSGTVSYIGMQSSRGDSMNSAVEYDVTVSLPSDTTYSDSIRLGMSATLEVLTYSNPNGIAIPPQAVKQDADGKKFVIYRSNALATPEKKYIRLGKSVASGIEVFNIYTGEVLLAE